jgi:hypothetical protein
VLGRFTAGEEAAEAGHHPHFAEDPLRCVDEWKADVASDIEDHEVKLTNLFFYRLQATDNLFFFARVHRKAVGGAASRFYLGD